MSIIQVKNNLHEFVQSTRLSFNEAAGTTITRVLNTDGLVTQWAIQIGETGYEQSEVLIGTSASGTTITHPTTRYEHSADTPVYFIKYNQVVFQKSNTGTSGSATSITDGTVTYQADSTWTQFDDTAGASTDAYRTRFRNSALGSNTAQSDWITTGGFSFYSLAKIRERAKNKLWDASFLTDQVIDEWINEWKDEMVTDLININEDYALGTVNVSFGTDGLGTITTGDFGQVRRVWINNSSGRAQSTKMNINDFTPNQVFSGDYPHHAWLGDNVFVVKPEGPGTAELVFYRWGTTMVNDTDELPQPMRPYTKSFTDYVVANAFLKDGKPEEYKNKLIEASIGKQNFVLNSSPRDKTGPEFIDIVEPTGG